MCKPGILMERNIYRIKLSNALILFIFLFFNTTQAAPLEYFPAQLVQPDGDTINVFLTGDEYYNWVHDADNYTIIQDQSSGFYVYADLVDGILVPTSFIVSKTDPKTTYLKSGLNISPEEMLEKRNKFHRDSPDDMGRAPTTGTINNLIVYIRFADDPEFTDLVSLYDNMFNNSTAGYNSMYNYFREASYNALSIVSSHYPITAGSTVVSYQDSNVRGYFQPYSTTNTIGYNGDTERRTREHTLLVNAVNAIASQVPTSLNLDGDNDGRVDNVCFLVYGTTTAWATLLWPHRWALYTYTVNINGKRVYDYNFNIQASVKSSGNGVLCHEMFHTLGAPDLYHYTSNGISPVGSWDIMESNKNPPQHMGAFMKFKYGKWISSIPVISNGTYTLNSLTSSSGNCFRINSPNSSSEYYVVEYRRKTGPFENSLPGTGMLIYRINTLAGNGNASGPPDEVYAYRPNGTLTVNGTVNSANYSSTVGRTAINDSTNPNAFLSNGNPGGLSIYSIGSSGETITFSVGAIPSQPPPAITNLSVINPSSSSLTLRWTVPSGITGYDTRISTSPISDTNAFNNAAPIQISTVDPSGSLQNFMVSPLNFNTTYYFSIRTINSLGVKSALSNAASGKVWIAPVISVNPGSIQRSVMQGTTRIDTIRLSNTTVSPSSLDFTVSIKDNIIPKGIIDAKMVYKPVESVEKTETEEKENPQEIYGMSLFGQGGPDAFGYKWIDSNDPNGPSYIWEDISTTGTLASNWIPTGTYSAKDEGYSGPFPIGFNFNFYGNNKQQVYVSSNGFIMFGVLSGSHMTNAVIPAAATPNDIVSAFWDDLDGSNQGTVHYKQDGSRFIVQFTNWARYNQTSSLTYQVVLHADGKIVFYYNSMSGILNSATIGIENSTGLVGLQVAYNSAYITNGLAVKISSEPDWLTSNTQSGVVYYGSTAYIILTMNSEECQPGTYDLSLRINSNDPVNPVINVPVIMDVRIQTYLNPLTALIEGFYNGDIMVSDTVTVELRNTAAPFSLIDQAKIILDNTGTGNGSFLNAINGVPYYLVIKHRNAVETWSASGLTFSNNTLAYDFTTSADKAFGNNLKQVGSKWCLYTGDINRDGIINTVDVGSVYTDGFYGISGYSNTDLNGDLYVEIGDISIVFSNHVLGIQSRRPAGFLIGTEQPALKTIPD
jgi:M6 family metalloprotease-like protein